MKVSETNIQGVMIIEPDVSMTSGDISSKVTTNRSSPGVGIDYRLCARQPVKILLWRNTRIAYAEYTQRPNQAYPRYRGIDF